MRSKHGLFTKNIKAIRVSLRNLKSRGTLETGQIEGIDRVLELLRALAHSLDTSNDRRARAQLEEISKWLVKTFIHLEADGE